MDVGAGRCGRHPHRVSSRSGRSNQSGAYCALVDYSEWIRRYVGNMATRNGELERSWSVYGWSQTGWVQPLFDGNVRDFGESDFLNTRKNLFTIALNLAYRF